MKRSFRDPASGVLKAFGFVAVNAPGDLVQDEADDFALEPGKWKLVAGAWIPSGLTTEQLKAAASAAIQNLLDSTAQAHGYDSIISLCSYANSTNLTWQKEGQYGCNFRDACWTKAEQIQTAVQAGTTPLPTVEEVLAQMPAVAWPV